MIKTIVALSCAAFAAILTAAQGQTMKTEELPKIESPLPYQVVQRDPATVRKDDPGNGVVLLRWTDPAPVSVYEWRAAALPNAFAQPPSRSPSHGVGPTPDRSLPGARSPRLQDRMTDVAALKDTSDKGTDWSTVKPTVTGDVCSASVTVPAGGWYRLELRRPGAATALASVEPVGVGEVFLIAGQSYAANCNDERLKVEEPQKRVACLDPKTGAWRVADDPQPGASNYKGGGTLWPAFGDGLVKQLKVPVGFANVAWKGTASSQWMPKGNLHNNMVAAARRLADFRAVLWQQGESDVIGGVAEDTYVANISAIRAALAKEVGDDFLWMPAKSTLHPNVYNNPKGEAVIRGAVDKLWKTKGFFPGPDTDTLTGDNRGGPSSKQHFSGTGQRNAAALWVEAVTKLIEGAPRR